MLYSVTIEDEIFLEVLSDVLLGDYSLFSASFNFLLYFLSAPLDNARIFFQNVMNTTFFLHLYWMLRTKSLQPIVELSLSFLILSSPPIPFLWLCSAHATVRDPAVRRTGDHHPLGFFSHFSSAETKKRGSIASNRLRKPFFDHVGSPPTNHHALTDFLNSSLTQ